MIESILSKAKAFLLAGGLILATLSTAIAQESTDLHFAAINGDVARIKTLLKAGADIEARDTGGGTPLLWAAILGHIDAITALLDAGAKIEAQDTDGMTPLHGAALLGQAESINTLLDAGADSKARNKNGKTPLDLVKEDSPIRGTKAYKRLRNATLN